MSLVAFIVLALAGSLACLVSRRRSGWSAPIGLGCLALVTIAAAAIRPGDVVRLGSGDLLVATAYGRLFLLIGGGSSLILCLIALSTTWQDDLAPALLVGLAGIGVALSAADPLVALLVLVGAGLATALVGVDARSTPPGIALAAQQVRLIVLAGLLAFLAVAWATPSGSGIGSDPGAMGLADLAMVLAVAVRFGVIPFHRNVARLTDALPGLGLPLLLVWIPAGLAAVVLSTTDGSAMTFLVPGGVGQAVIVGIATLTLGLGAIGGWLQDDLEHIVGYSIIQDAGFVLLGLSIGGPVGHGPTRLWLLILVAGKTAFSTWAAVVRTRFQTARLPDLGGWARRSPLLAAAFVAIVLGTVGIPGLLIWNTRTALINGASGAPLQALLLVAGLASLAYYGRVAWTGLRRVSVLVAAAATDRPVAPTRDGTVVATARAAAAANRAPIAAALVALLAAVSLLVAVGGLDGPAAADAAAPRPSSSVISP